MVANYVTLKLSPEGILAIDALSKVLKHFLGHLWFAMNQGQYCGIYSEATLRMCQYASALDLCGYLSLFICLARHLEDALFFV